MPAQVSCPHCEQTLLVPDGAAGKRIKCRHCESVSRVTEAGDGRVALESEAAGGVPTPAVPPTPRTADSATAPCPQCGADVTSQDQFCTSCGAEVTGETKDELELKREALARRAATRVRQQKRRRQQRGQKVAGAAKVVLALSILFLVAGTIVGFMAKGEADEAHGVLAAYADDEELELEGATWTAAELRAQIDAKVTMVFVTNYILALVMLGIFFWARKSPLPALTTALCVYLAVLAMGAVFDPTTIFKGILLKVIFITLLIAGIKAALAERAAAQAGEDVSGGGPRRRRTRSA